MQTNIRKWLENNFFNTIIKFSSQFYFGWVIFIGLLTLLPGSVIPNIDWNFLSLDKIIHLSVFTILAYFGSAFFIYGFNKKPLKNAVLLSFIIAVLYGTVLEYSQTFIPQRGFDYADLSANILGAISGTIIFLLLKNKYQ